jgi:hypothetical protein
LLHNPEGWELGVMLSVPGMGRTTDGADVVGNTLGCLLARTATKTFLKALHYIFRQE